MSAALQAEAVHLWGCLAGHMITSLSLDTCFHLLGALFETLGPQADYQAYALRCQAWQTAGKLWHSSRCVCCCCSYSDPSIFRTQACLSACSPAQSRASSTVHPCCS